jgi:flagellar basal body-associated protein FliL
MSIPEKKPEAVTKAQSSDRKPLVLIFIIVFLALISLVLSYMLLTKTQQSDEQTTEILQLENTTLTLKSDLQEMLIQYDTVTVANEKMQAEILAQREQIKDLLKQVDKHKDDAWIIHKLKKEAGTLREIMKGYLFTIDSLNTLNVHLRADRDSLNVALSQVTKQKDQLASKTSNLEGIIAKGSVLPVSDLLAEAIRVRSSGKQSSTNRADRAEMIKICGRLGENKIAEKGKKTLYLRIISPDARVLDDGTGEPSTFKFDGVSGVYSVKRDIDYQNEAQDVCIYYTVNGELPTGQYIAELYESETKIGTATFDLR